MRETKEIGVTLIALVITIIVLLILAGVAINLTIGDNGIFKKADESAKVYENAANNEATELNNLYGELSNLINKVNGGNSEEPPATPPEDVIETTTSYVGYYADIDGDGEPDGVIYADLAVAVSGQWGDSDGTFSYEAITGTKNYYVSKTNYEGEFGTKDVLTATGSGADRFYVMALDDFNAGTYYCWYDAAYDDGISDYSTVTSTSFGTGKTNTATMITKWNSSAYGAQNDNSSYADMWGAIQDEVADGWFVPSKEEWSAFGYNLGITSSNYGNYGLSTSCWSSSLYNKRSAWRARFNLGYMRNDYVGNGLYVRLSATF